MRIEENPGYVEGFEPELGIRELGGWPTADGRRIVHGRFYRGSAICDLNPQEKRRFQSFNIARILDLRSSPEVVGNADWVPEGAQYERVCGMYNQGTEVDFSPAGIERLTEIMPDENPELLMPMLYASMAIGNPALHEAARIIVDEDLPVFFHCTAGKDRTGVVAAFIMMLLGADDATITEEFLLTNEYRASIINMDPALIPADVPQDLKLSWSKANSVDKLGLDAFLGEIDKHFETREDYFDQEFNIDADLLAEIRARYTV